MNRVFVTGKVSDNKDPESLGRLKVELTGFPETIETPWLRQVLPGASTKSAGFVFLPAVGDEVVLLSPVIGEDMDPGHLSSMLVLGAVYSGKDKPKFEGKSPAEEVKRIQTSAGHDLMFDDKNGKVTLRAKSDSCVLEFDAKASPKITIKAGGATITVGKDATGAIEINTSGKLKISGAMGVEISSAAKVEIKSTAIAINGVQTKVIGVDTTVGGAKILLAGMTMMG